ncbi:unnamed protein product [Dibothriocephalus latus]|uniref:Uncharacterized protein n=1 Tax=Dibothriocephalus latus TaxID=60516 RepID=A0A3P6SPW5_DIBLA|nr:unnamed protein product [Dibothriocephalus latus]
MPSAKRPTNLGIDPAHCPYSNFNPVTPADIDADCLQVCHPNPPAPPDIQSSPRVPAMAIQSLEDIRGAEHPTGLLEGRTEHKSHPNFNKPPMACFPRYKRVRFAEKPQTQQYSCSPMEEKVSFGKFRRSQEWQTTQSMFSFLDNPKASKTCLPSACFKRKPTTKDEAIWKSGKSLRENITAVYVADSQLDEGFVDSSTPLGGYMYPESPVRGDEWEGYERPSKFWTTEEYSESHLYEPVRGRSVCPTYMRPERLTRLNLPPEDYYGDTSGCESCDLSPSEPPETPAFLEQPTFVNTPIGTPSFPNAYGTQPYSRPLEACPDQPRLVSNTIPDVVGPGVYGIECQTTVCSLPAQEEGQGKPKKTVFTKATVYIRLDDFHDGLWIVN